MSATEFDVIVLGAGAPGEVCAGRIADGGLEVAIVESHLIGGECSYYACMPSKALLRPAELLDEARRVPGAAEAASGEFDPAAVLARRDEVIHDLDDSSQLPWLEEREIALFRGEGRLDGERTVLVGEQRLTARRAVVIATGSAAAIPPVDGLEAARPWNNREGTTSKSIPASMIILGGGPVGCELSQAWSTLGTKVTLLQGDERLLPREEPFAGDQVAEALRSQHGVEVRTGAFAKSVSRRDGVVSVELDDGEAVEAAEILVAIGRSPRTGDIGLDSVGVETGKGGFLETDERLAVSGLDWLYGVGDVTGRALFTHMGKYQGWVVGENLTGRSQPAALAEGIGSPRVTFTDPQVAAVGKTLEQAREAGLDAEAVDVPTDGTAGASFYGRETGGTSRLVIDKKAGLIVGATFTGFETADFLQAATVAIVGEVPLERLRHAVAPYPTRSEIWLKLLESYGI